jgi:predicted RNA binding protein YcfA (HicA-like mRNA interferase family)
MAIKVRDVIKLIEFDGWYLVRTKGSHRQYKHDTKKGLVTIAGKPSSVLHPKTLNSILKQAGLKEEVREDSLLDEDNHDLQNQGNGDQ